MRRGDDVRVRVADVEAADAAGEIDEDVAVDVGDRGAARLGRGEREGDLERRRDARGQPLEHLRERGPGTSVLSSIVRVAAIVDRA